MTAAERSERLAKDILALAVRAAAYDEAKHPRGHGGQWTGKAGVAEQGTAHADPPGEASGRIRHAVLVMDGKRYRGPSHFQALQEFEKRGGTYSGKGAYAEGFETESGHFLDREQAAKYVSRIELTPAGVKRLERLTPGKEWLAAQDVSLATMDGQAYTQDAVMAAAPALRPDLAAHDAARDEARADYQRTVNQAVGRMEAEALEAKAKKDEEARKRKARREEMEAALLLLLLYAGARIYRATRTRLASAIPGQLPGAAGPTTAAPVSPPGGVPAPGGLSTTAPGPTGAIEGGPAPGEAEKFAKDRLKLLKGFLKDSLARLDAVAQSVPGMEDAALLLAEEAKAIEAGQGRVVAETESQAVYGAAMIRLLRQAGFATKIWATMKDDKVRPSHVECGEQGEVPMDEPFSNGLMYPGDPNGGPEEVCSCRCWLVGGRRVAGTGHLTASEPHDVSGEARDDHGRWTNPSTIESIAESFKTAANWVEKHRAAYKSATDKLPDGTKIGKWTKANLAGDVVWLHDNGKRGTASIVVEAGQGPVDKVLRKHGIKVEDHPMP